MTDPKHETIYKLPLVLDPQPEGGYTVTCPLLPELITEGDTAEEALDNVSDALAALLEAYETLKCPMPPVLKQGGQHPAVTEECAGDHYAFRCSVAGQSR